MPLAAAVDLQAPIQALPRFCEGRWRAMIAGLGVSSLVVLGFAVEEHFASSGTWMPDATRAGAAEGSPRSGGTGAAAPNGLGAARQVFSVVGAPRSSNATLTSVGTSSSSAQPARPFGRSERTAFAGAAQRIRPAVLSIRAAYGATNSGGRGVERLGSALVVDARGLAVTCRHVVAGASVVLARRFRDVGRWLPARVLAAEDDLALLQVEDSSAFPVGTFADSQRLRVGDWVLAVGHPFQLGMTVTAGIVGRRNTTLTLPGGFRYTGLLQTDAPINEGSSGGPLVNTAGEVVGLNVAIYSPSGAFSGAGFAIPSERVRAFVSMATGSSAAGATRTGEASPSLPSWGVGLVDLTPGLSAQLGFNGSGGVLVTSVTPSSPAEAARLAAGDIITEIAGQPVVDAASAQQIRNELPSGRSVPIRTWRRGQPQTLILVPQRVDRGQPG
jgi:S1-C subfamily serine protease